MPTQSELTFGRKYTCADLHAFNVLAPLASHYIPWSGGAIRPSALVYVLNDIAVQGRRCVLELEGGVSTLFIARLLHQQGGRLTTVEQDAEWADWLERRLEFEGLTHVTQICRAPLEQHPLSMDQCSWYADSAMDSLKSSTYDFLLVDGPSAGAPELSMSRYPAVPYFIDQLEAHATICLDDAQRPGEQAILRAWEDQPRLAFTFMESISLAVGRFSPHVPLNP
jgi:predicted O-methyltransferase YrrM